MSLPHHQNTPSPTSVAMRAESSSVSSDFTKHNNDETTTTTTYTIPLAATRTAVVQLMVLVGNLSSTFLQHVPLDGTVSLLHHHQQQQQPVVQPIATAMKELLGQLQHLSTTLQLDLETAISNKMELNRRKYPVELCRGRSGKYTEYSQSTGITKTVGQSTVSNLPTSSSSSSSLCNNNNNNTTSFPTTNITAAIRHFAHERQWSRFHQPRNLLLALTGEVGELAELFQFKGDDEHTTVTAQELDKMGQELADVAIYLLRLADVCGVEL